MMKGRCRVKCEDEEDVAIMAKELILEKLDIACMTSVNPQLLEDATIDVVADMILDDFLVHLRTHVYAERVDEVMRDWIAPADWWQAFKDRWFPAWAKRRWPVRFNYEHVELKRYVTFPENTYLWPKALGRPVIQILDSSYNYATPKKHEGDEE